MKFSRYEHKGDAADYLRRWLNDDEYDLLSYAVAYSNERMAGLPEHNLLRTAGVLDSIFKDAFFYDGDEDRRMGWWLYIPRDTHRLVMTTAIIWLNSSAPERPGHDLLVLLVKMVDLLNSLDETCEYNNMRIAPHVLADIRPESVTRELAGRELGDGEAIRWNTPGG